MLFDRRLVLREDAPRRPYRSNVSTASFECPLLKGLHYGQRKLALSEVEFFLQIAMYAKNCSSAASLKVLVVYAGAACGLHLPFLFSLFPTLDFVLIDPAPFCSQVKEIASKEGSCVLELIEDFCTPELCLRIRRTYCETHDIFLVSDIRSGEPTGMSLNQEHTDMIQQDNYAQREWCFSLEVQAAMLKFHPPYPATKDSDLTSNNAQDTTVEEYTYLDGTQLLGVWAPKSSSEVRLVVVGPFKRGYEAPARRYHCTAHEEQCYAYNVDNRYEKDCAAERLILETYLSAFPDAYKSVEQLSKTLSEKLGYPLFCPLEPGFTEQHARWVTLLYSSGNPSALQYFELLKNDMSVAQVARLVSEHKDCSEIPADVKVGDVVLTPHFWSVFAAGDFAAVYCFPVVRWRWRQQAYRHRLSNKQDGSKRNHRRFAGKKRTANAA
ncbi:putative Poly A polymerase regulatory subunit [Leishmania utingensis]|uniref:Cap-specific mRNA (nucleoside-2'-O-)-methyltransferase n=1 Tax=Leishmania utingensis TaxID=653362 RepID=A0AAW3AHJ0_9TRYP